MAGLARREDLAGKVQMIYIDPLYGIGLNGNFQPALGQRDVKDREPDLTRACPRWPGPAATPRRWACTRPSRTCATG